MNLLIVLAAILLVGMTLKILFVTSLFLLAFVYHKRERNKPIVLPASTPPQSGKEVVSPETASDGSGTGMDSNERRKSIKEVLRKWWHANSYRLLFGASRTACIMTGQIPMHTVRRFLYRFVFRLSMGKNVILYHGAEIWDAHHIVIDEGAIIGDHVILDGRAGITIGKHVNISTGVWAYTYQHNVNSPTFGLEDKCGPIIIGDRAWISNRAVILPGVVIGEGAVVAAGSVVTKSLEPFGIYGGVPAKKIGERNRNIQYVFDGKSLNFF